MTRLSADSGSLMCRRGVSFGCTQREVWLVLQRPVGDPGTISALECSFIIRPAPNSSPRSPPPPRPVIAWREGRGADSDCSWRGREGLRWEDAMIRPRNGRRWRSKESHPGSARRHKGAGRRMRETPKTLSTQATPKICIGSRPKIKLRYYHIHHIFV